MINDQANTFCLNPRYSTTRMVSQEKSVIENVQNSKVQRIFVLPADSQRQDDGGLRTKGYLKKTFNGKPLVTVISIVYNGGERIDQTIKSVITQGYDNVEYIVIDGGSTDGTLDIIREHEHAIDYWVSEPDLGIGDAFNKGVIVSTGEWVNFMNCGDRFASPQAIQYIMDSIDVDADLIFGKANVTDDKGEIFLTVGSEFNEKKFYRGRMLPHQSVFHNFRYFQENGLFDDNLKTAMCYELLLRKRPLSIVFIDETISTMLAGGVHESEDYLRLRETRTVKKKHSTDNSNLLINFDYLYSLARALVKRGLNHLGLKYLTRKIRQWESKLK